MLPPWRLWGNAFQRIDAAFETQLPPSCHLSFPCGNLVAETWTLDGCWGTEFEQAREMRI